MKEDRIKLAIDRSIQAISLKPSLALGTGISRTRVVNGLHCETEEGEWKFKADMPASVGGTGSGPTPGIYGRAALGSCLAIGYMMMAAQKGIQVSRLEVEIQADYDDGALLGTSDEAPGYLEVRYNVLIESDADEVLIMDLLDEADKRSPYLDVFSRAQKCRREVQIVTPKLLS
jgi:uncharacterized OsmC-like protein